MTITGPETRVASGPVVSAETILAGCSIDLVGVPTQLSARDARGAIALASLLRCAPPAAGPVRLRIRVERDALPTPGGTPIRFGTGLEGWSTEPGRLVLHNTTGLVATATADEVVIGGDAAPYEQCLRHLLAFALAHALSAHGHQVVHGGAVAHAGRAAVVIGGTGSGKSTLAYCAHLAGWEVLADDLVAVHLRDGRPYVAGIPRPISVPSDVLEHAGELEPVRADARGRYELPVTVASPGWFPVAGVIRTAHAAGPTTQVAGLDTTDALHEVLGSCLTARTPDDVRALLPLAAAVARLPRVTFEHGTDSATRVRAGIERFDVARAALRLD